MTNSRDLARLIIVDELGAENIFRRNNSFQCRLNDLAWRRRDYAKVESRRKILAKHASKSVQVLFEQDAFADFAQVLSAHGSKLRIVAHVAHAQASPCMRSYLWKSITMRP